MRKSKKAKEPGYKLGLLESVINVNEVQSLMMIDLPKSRIGDQDGKRIAALGGTILMCVIHGLVNKEKGLKYLESLKPVIRDEC